MTDPTARRGVPRPLPAPSPMLDALSRQAESLARRAVTLQPFPQPPLVRTRYPVLLMHGFGALANIMQQGVLHEEAMYLRAHGVLAFAPHVNPYDTVTVRARTWADRLDRVLEETGAEKVNLVGFSSAGLEARALAGRLGRAGEIASIVTVSAPHRGSPIVDYLLSRTDRLKEWTVALMDFLGRASYAAELPRTEEALYELSPEYVCGTFNAEHPLPDGIFCASYAGRAGKGTGVPIYPPLMIPNRILYEAAGVNDGLVPTASAEWGEVLGILDADHAKQIGLRLAPGPFDSKAFFLGLARDLATRGL